jgi:hypothetical protein
LKDGLANKPATDQLPNVKICALVKAFGQSAVSVDKAVEVLNVGFGKLDVHSVSPLPAPFATAQKACQIEKYIANTG